MRSPMNAIHERLGAALEVRDGWEIPGRYRDVDEERQAIQSRLAVADITARGKIDVRGPVNGALTVLPANTGATVARISREWLVVFTPASEAASALEMITRSAGNTMVTDATSIYAGIALAGPGVEELLLRVLTVDPATLKAGDALATQALRIPAIVLRRALSLNLVELYVPSEYGRYAFESVIEVGHRLGAKPVGWDALRAEGWR